MTRLRTGPSGDRIMAGTRDFSVPKHVHIGFGPHPPIHLFIGYRGSFPGIKRPGREAYLSSPCSMDFKNVLSCAATSAVPSVPSWHAPGRFHIFKCTVMEWLQLNRQ